MMGPMIESMVGQTFTLKATAAGQVSDIKLPEKLTEQFDKQRAVAAVVVVVAVVVGWGHDGRVQRE